MNKFIDLQEIKSDELVNSILAELIDYPKYKSLVAMWASGLPVPKTIIIGNVDESTEKLCNKVLRKWKTNEVVVRTDVAGGAVQAPSVQGCKIDEAWVNIKNFFKMGYLPMVISTGDIFHNAFSTNVLVDPCDTKSFYIEAVGAGFCATDINKRDIITESGIMINDSGTIKLINYQVVDSMCYKKYVNKVKENQINKEVVKRGKPFDSKNEAKLWVDDFLSKNNALLLNSPKYKPVAPNYIHKISSFVPSMIKAGKIMNFENEKFIVSLAFVLENGKENPYFFDIHPFNGYKK